MGSGNWEDNIDPPLDDLFDILSSRRRRYILQCLREHGPQVSLPDLADEVSVQTYDCPITDVPEEDVLEIYVSLYHRHIPKLADAGIVDYEQERDLVRLAENADQVFHALPEDLLDTTHGE